MRPVMHPFQQFLILFMAGLMGIVLAIINAAPILQSELNKLPGVEKLPRLEVLLALQGFQLIVLLAIAIAIGLFCTKAVGLKSYALGTAPWPQSKQLIRQLQLGCGVGLLTAIALGLIDFVMRPWLPAALKISQPASDRTLNLLLGILYGGITEEILMRWGFMSLLVWASWKILKRGVLLPERSLYQGAIALSALIFGLLHLPATALITPLTPCVIGRALLLNGIAGLGYGWLFWQSTIEIAMLAHAFTHIGFFLMTLISTKLVS
jgi:hypothetical protein